MSAIDRRKFIKTTAGAAVGAAAGLSAARSQDDQPLIPTRKFATSDKPASVMGEGGSSQFFKALPADHDQAVEKGVELLRAAVEGGVTYFDTSHSYRRGGDQPIQSETLYGMALNDHRERVLVATKIQARDRDGALAQFELSLKRLNMQYVDVLQLHAMAPKDGLEAINSPTGAFQAFREMKDQGLAKFIGITGHATAPHMTVAVDMFEGLDTALYPVNAAVDERDRRSFEDEPGKSDGHFETLLLPKCIEKGITVISMKSTAQGYLIGEGPGKSDAQTLIKYAMSVPGVTTTIVGPGSLANLKSNLTMAQGFVPMRDAEKEELVAGLHSSDRRFAYLQPDYRDA